MVNPSVMLKPGSGLEGDKLLTAAAGDLVKYPSFVEMCFLRLLPTPENFFHRKHLHCWKSSPVALSNLLQAGAKIMLRRHLLRGGRVKKPQVGLRDLAGAVPIHVLIDHRHRRLGADAFGRIDNIEAPASNTVDHQQGFVLPTDKNVADIALD